MPITSDEFRGALSRFASGVTVVTTKCEDDQLRGITVSAFSSLSLDPPLILVCIDKRASLHDHLKEGRHFAVNMLAEDQQEISNRFASRVPDRFEGLAWKEGIAGSPLIEGTLATVECRIAHAYPGGDHTIIVGEVVATDVKEGKPLVYCQGNYARIT